MMASSVSGTSFRCLFGLLALLPLVHCECNEDIGRIEAQIDVEDQDGNLHSEADPWLRVDFGDVDNGAGAKLTRNLTVLSVGTTPLRIDNVCLVRAETAEEATADVACVSAADAPFVFPNITGAYNPGERVAFPVEFAPKQGGPAHFFLRISSNAEKEPAIAIELVGRGTGGRLCAEEVITDFGAVYLGSTETRQIRLSNCGVRSIEIDTFAWQLNPDDVFAVSLDGAAPMAPIGPLAEDESILLDVTFTPAEARAYRDTLAGSIQLTTRTLVAADEPVATESYTLLLVGDGRNPPSCRVNVVPQTIQFGAVAANATATQQLIVQSVGECACSIENVESPDPSGAGFFFEEGVLPTFPVLLRGTSGCEDDPNTADAPNLLSLTVSYTAPDRQTPQADNAVVRVVTTDANEPERTVNLEANGGGTPYCELQVTPRGSGGFIPVNDRDGVVEFGRVTVYFEKRLPITLKNVGNAACSISNVQWDVEENTLANEFNLEFDDGTPVPVGNAGAVSLNPGESKVYQAVFAPTHTIEGGFGNIFSFGSYSASSSLSCGLFGPNTRCNGVRFITTDSVTETVTGDAGVFSLGFSATPVEPAIDVIPGELDFGLVTLGCGSPEREVTVYNTGSGALLINQPYAEPETVPATFSVQAQAPSFPHEIQPGSSMRLRIRYYANQLGEVTGRVVIPTIEGNSEGPPVTIPLRGEGTLENEQTDVFDQFSDPKADVLWVVDDSGSMDSYQSALAANFPQFFTASNVEAADYHIAVTTTLTVDSSCIPGPFGTTSCAEHEMTGYYTACSGNDRFLTPASSNPQSQFNCNVRVSNSNNVNPSRPKSDSAESGLQAARRFLEAPNITDNSINGGFLRDDAKLHVIVVSDEPDQSEGPTDLYVDFFRNLKGFRNDALVAVSAISPPEDGCGDLSGDSRYIEVTEALNGRHESICEDDWSTLMTNLGLDSLGLKVEYFLSRAADAVTLSVCVRNGGAGDSNCQVQSQTNDGAATGYFYDPNSNSIVFNPGSVPPRGARIEVNYEAFCY